MITTDLKSCLASFIDAIQNLVFTNQSGEVLAENVAIEQITHLLLAAKANRKNVYFIGNGGSAAIVAHVQNDLINKCQIKSHVLQDVSLLTCMSNDYGYSTAYARILATCFDEGDVLVAVSSSGNSANMLEATKVVAERKGSLITLTGFSDENHLRKLGNVNVWLPSVDYGEVEVGHQFVLHYVSDSLAKLSN